MILQLLMRFFSSQFGVPVQQADRHDEAHITCDNMHIFNVCMPR